MKDLRFGILGFAHVHADAYAHILLDMPGVNLVGFSESNASYGERAVQQYCLKHFESHASLLAQNLDAVIVCSENSRRREPVVLAANAGVHVLCEKPIATNLDDARAMRDSCHENNTKFMTAFPMRFDPSLQQLRARILGGELGQVFGLNGVNHSENPALHRAWFADKELAGGGASMDHVVHLADLYHWLLKAETKTVQANLVNPFAPEFSVETAGLALLTLENKNQVVHAAIDCSWSRPNNYPRWGHLKLEVMAENGAVEIDAFAEHLNVYTATGLEWPGFGPDLNWAMLQEFCDCIRQDRQPQPDWHAGFAAMRVALACLDSGGQVIQL